MQLLLELVPGFLGIPKYSHISNGHAIRMQASIKPSIEFKRPPERRSCLYDPAARQVNTTPKSCWARSCQPMECALKMNVTPLTDRKAIQERKSDDINTLDTPLNRSSLDSPQIDAARSWSSFCHPHYLFFSTLPLSSHSQQLLRSRSGHSFL